MHDQMQFPICLIVPIPLEVLLKSHTMTYLIFRIAPQELFCPRHPCCTYQNLLLFVQNYANLLSQNTKHDIEHDCNLSCGS